MRVLLVKLSSLGDVVHSLPAAMDLQTQVPGVHIDWVVEPAFAPLLELCPAVKRVIPCDMRKWRRQWWTVQTRQAWRSFQQDLQSKAYDAVIDLQGLSKSALISKLAKLSPNGKRYAMANRTEGSGYEAPTRWVADVAVPCEWHSHALDRGVGFDLAQQGHHVGFNALQSGMVLPFETQHQHRRGVGRSHQSKAIGPIDAYTVDVAQHRLMGK